MRNLRVKRKRHLRALEKEALHAEVKKEKNLREQAEVRNVVSRKMARTFWDRWHFELEERKLHQKRERELKFALIHNVKGQAASKSGCHDHNPSIQSIDRSLLVDPVEFEDRATDRDVFVGRGSFGIVKYQSYRGINVAVKEFLPCTVAESVQTEAQILSKICHPHLPLLLGMCLAKRPYMLVMQYHGINGKSITLHHQLVRHHFEINVETWIILCCQIVDALHYLHSEVRIIHNDIKADNVIFSPTIRKHDASPLCTESELQIVLIDFGKATDRDYGKKYELTYSERRHYHFHYKHIAPEVIDGMTKQNIKSDIYSLGKLLKKIEPHVRIAETSFSTKFTEVIEKCIYPIPSRRPSISQIYDVFKVILARL